MAPQTDSHPNLRKVETALGLLLTGFLVYAHVQVLRHAGALWRDEVVTVNLVGMPTWGEMLKSNYVDSFPVLWHVLLRLWTGVGLGDTDSGLRLLCLIVGLGIAGMLWAAARQWGYRAPLVALLLFALNPAVFRFANGVRAYSLGILTMLVLVMAIWRVIRDPTPGRIALAVGAAVLAVHSAYSNVPLLVAICLAAGAVCLRHRHPRTIGILVGIGLVSALSMLPYVSTFLYHREWSFLVRRGFAAADAMTKFREAMVYAAPADSVMYMVWVVLFIGCVVGGFRRLKRAAPDGPETQKDLVLFFTVLMVAGVVCFVGYLVFLGLPTLMWYYAPIMAVLAVSFDAVLHAILRDSRRGRIARVVVVLGLAVLIAPSVQEGARVRSTNVDLISRHLEEVAGKDDLIVVNPWYVGVTFDRYYHGPTPWETLPQMDQHRFQLYAAFIEKMKATHPIKPLLDRMARTLQSGGKVWMVGAPAFAKQGQVPRELPPAPFEPVGWSEGAYARSWSCQVGYFLQGHATGICAVDVPWDDPINPYEAPVLLVAEGWRAETPDPPSSAPPRETP